MILKDLAGFVCLWNEDDNYTCFLGLWDYKWVSTCSAPRKAPGKEEVLNTFLLSLLVNYTLERHLIFTCSSFHSSSITFFFCFFMDLSSILCIYVVFFPFLLLFLCMMFFYWSYSTPSIFINISNFPFFYTSRYTLTSQDSLKKPSLYIQPL